MKSKKNIELILNSVLLIIFVWFAYKAFYELFTNELGVHFSRVVLRPMGNGTKIVEFALNAPTITSFIILFMSLLSICAAMMIYIIKIFAVDKKTRIYWIFQITGFLICLLSIFYSIYDFFNTSILWCGVTTFTSTVFLRESTFL
jgi:hypothetical protein